MGPPTSLLCPQHVYVYIRSHVTTDSVCSLLFHGEDERGVRVVRTRNDASSIRKKGTPSTPSTCRSSPPRRNTQQHTAAELLPYNYEIGLLLPLRKRTRSYPSMYSYVSSKGGRPLSHAIWQIAILLLGHIGITIITGTDRPSL